MATNSTGVYSAAEIARRDVHTLLPYPDPEPLFTPIVSVDDHLVEPPTIFEGRLPARLRDEAPEFFVGDDGIEYWRFGDEIAHNVMNVTSVVGRPQEEWTFEPQLFEEMRKGSYDAAARLRDMDLCGIWASMAFPSNLFQFCGQRVHRLRSEVGIAVMHAYNDWVYEEWCGQDRRRLVPQQITWLPDPELAAKEIYRNAKRGFPAVTFSENPEALGYPSVHRDHWDPLFRACEETGTVVNLHVGSSSQVIHLSSDAPAISRAVLFPVNAMMTCVDWVYAKVPIRYPNLKIALSESALSWVPFLMERLRRSDRLQPGTGDWDVEETFEEVFLRAFYFSSIEDPVGMQHRDEIGLDHIMVEVDYPHPDSSWPLTQQMMRQQLGGMPREHVEAIAYGNACRLYGITPPDPDWVAARKAGADVISTP